MLARCVTRMLSACAPPVFIGLALTVPVLTLILPFGSFCTTGSRTTWSRGNPFRLTVVVGDAAILDHLPDTLPDTGWCLFNSSRARPSRKLRDQREGCLGHLSPIGIDQAD